MNMLSEITGEGQPIVLVPGGLTGWLSWEPHAKILSAKRKVIRVQLLNVQYGFENRALQPDYSVKTESRALAATLDSIRETKPVDFVAWSYGALVTLDFALDNPGRVRTLTLIEPPALWILLAHGALDAETQRTITFFETLQGNISEDQLASFLQFAGFLRLGQSARELPQWALWTSYRQSLRNSPAVVNHTDNVKRLNEFKSPTLLVKGTGSSLFLHRIIDLLGSALRHSQVIEIPAGHGPHIVSMDLFLATMAEFQDRAKQ